MSARLLDQLARRGISVRLVGKDQLGVTGPESGLSPQAVAFLQQHKADLLTALAEREAVDPTANFPTWISEPYRRAAREAASIVWRDQIMMWPNEVHAAWENRVVALMSAGGAPRENAEARAYLEYRHHNVTQFPTEEPVESVDPTQGMANQHEPPGRAG